MNIAFILPILPRQGFVVPGSGYGAGCGEKRGSFQRTGLHASRILVDIQGCKTVAMRFNHRPLLLDLGEKGVYSSYMRGRFQKTVCSGKCRNFLHFCGWGFEAFAQVLEI